MKRTYTEPLISIGLPTFNGAKLLHECLTNIAQQSYINFVVLISDNASTDDTQRIAQDFASADSRFHYFRQEIGVSAVKNFTHSLRQATSPLFIWHADDDLWAPDYLEKLVALFDTHPHCKLAVSRTIWERSDGAPSNVFDFPALGSNDVARMQRLLRSNASWIYGLFDRETVSGVMAQVEAEYGEPWGADQLILFYFGAHNLIAGTNKTYFLQRILIRAANDGATSPAHRWKRDRSAIELMNYYAEARGRFFRIAAGWIDEMTVNPFRVMLWRAFLWHFMGRKLFKARTIWRRKLRHWAKRAVEKA